MDEQPQPRVVDRVLPAPVVEPGSEQAEAPNERPEGSRGVTKAVALEYHDGKQRAPVVTASGRGEMAEQIIALARKHGVYVQPDPDLVELLARLDIGTAIPPQLYYVVAEILAFVYNLNRTQTSASG